MTAALEVIGLTKHFGGLPAVDKVTITVPQGDRRLLLGPNGAGKSSTW
jgi:ABC-type branched-subunit amino acid transport system ATPase component